MIDRFVCLFFTGAWLLSAQIQAELRVDAGARLHKIDRRIYGHHLEHFGRIIQGGLWAELLRNRKFYPIDPDRSQVADPWKPQPGRRFVSYAIDRSETINGIASQRVSTFGESRHWRGIQQTGFDVLAGKEYAAYAWIKIAPPVSQPVAFRLESQPGELAAQVEARVEGSDWRKYEVRLKPDRDLRPAVFRIAFREPGAKWIGAASLMPADNVEGMRRDVLDLVRSMTPAIIRWPGGGYPDSYDWRKAIGPRDRRPPQDILPFGQPHGYDHGMDANDFGTDEFLRFCELIGAEPYITANFGSGTPEMAAAWVEYTNGPPTSPWGARRAANGRAEPHKVKHWSIGNEIWGPFETGYTDGEGYATFFIPIAKAMRAADPTVLITAVGRFDTPDRREWNEPVLRLAWEQMDFLSLHHYYPGGFRPPVFENRPLEFYRAIVAEPSRARQGVDEMIEMVDRIAAGRKRIQIAFDEWSEWDWDFAPPVETPHRSSVNQFIDMLNKSGLEFNQTARDGIFGARILHMLMRRADRAPIAIRTHIINSLGAIRTDSTRAFVTASGVVMQLYGRHSGATLVRTEQRAPSFDVPEVGWKDISYLDATATVSEDGRKLFLHLINLHPEEPLVLRVQIAGMPVASNGILWQIAPGDFLARNDFGITRVAIERHPVDGMGPAFQRVLPPHSVTALEANVQ